MGIPTKVGTGSVEAADISLAQGSILLGQATGYAGADATLKAAGLVPVGNGTTVAALNLSAAGTIPMGNGTTVAALALGTAAQVPIVNAGATAIAYNTLAGDVTVGSTGTTTIGSEKVEPSMEDNSTLVSVVQDFLDKGSLGELNEDSNALWRYDTTVIDGATVLAHVSRQGNGEFAAKMSTTNQVEEVTLSWGDHLMIPTPASSKPVVIFRLRAPTFTTNNEFIRFGLCSAITNQYHITGGAADAWDYSIWFKYGFTGGAATTLLTESDDGVTDRADLDTTQAWPNNAYREFKLDCTLPATCKAYWRATLGGAWTDITVAGAGNVMDLTNAGALQPIVQLVKNGTGSPSFILDYIKVYWLRS